MRLPSLDSPFHWVTVLIGIPLGRSGFNGVYSGDGHLAITPDRHLIVAMGELDERGSIGCFDDSFKGIWIDGLSQWWEVCRFHSFLVSDLLDDCFNNGHVVNLWVVGDEDVP